MTKDWNISILYSQNTNHRCLRKMIPLGQWCLIHLLALVEVAMAPVNQMKSSCMSYWRAP